ncbi:ABC transporter permease [Clostridia bacterium]|nr:ABC transporter permease [Clostridia bacterium]
MIGYTNKVRKKTPFTRAGNFLLAIVVPIIIIIFWELIVAQGVVNKNLVPPPSKLWTTFIGLISSGKLQTALSVSFNRVFAGFFIAAAIGIVFGFIIGLFEPINKALSSIINILRPIPTIALIPIFIIVLGIGESANISIITIGALWPILLNTTAGVLSVDRKLMELAYVYRIGKLKVVFQIILPSAMYSMITGLRLGIGGAWMSVVAAEMIGATSGIGYMIMFAKSLAQAANMYVLVLVIGIIGLIIDRVLLLFQNIIRKRFLAIES